VKHFYLKPVRGGPLVAQIHKCGSSAIEFALHEYETVPVEESHSYDVRVGFIRNPVKRFKSWYSFIRGQYLEGHRLSDMPVSVVESYHGWVDYALENLMEQFVAPYTTTFPNMTNVHKLSDIEKVWRDYFVGWRRPTQQNAFYPAEDIDDYRLKDIERAYAGDLDLWHSL
jgi:hypothetical protein